MKKIIAVLLLLIVVGCKKETAKNYANFSGTIKNMPNSEFKVFSKTYNKKIKTDANGNFKDTLHLTDPKPMGLIINRQQVTFFIKNGYDIKLEANANELVKTIQFSGKGGRENEYLLSQFEYGKRMGMKENNLFLLDKDKFDIKLEEYKTGLDSIDYVYKDIDTTLLNFANKQTDKVFNFLGFMYETQHQTMLKVQKGIEGLKPGIPSPTFNNIVDDKGKTHSLKDYKGKYVYISIWTTWVNKYFQDFESIKQLRNQYKNIAFINICGDSKQSSGTWRFAKDKWQRKLKQKNLDGIQLFLGEDQSFIQQYFAINLPRYIIIDPYGKIVNADAPSPSNPKLNELLNKL